MNDIRWQPTNEPGSYDAKRVAELKPIQQAIENLGLPLIRSRKLKGIYNALEMQIEDGGDAPEVNNLLLEALRQAVIHQVGEKPATTMIQVIDDFAKRDNRRWERSRTEKQTSTKQKSKKK